MNIKVPRRIKLPTSIYYITFFPVLHYLPQIIKVHATNIILKSVKVPTATELSAVPQNIHSSNYIRSKLLGRLI